MKTVRSSILTLLGLLTFLSQYTFAQSAPHKILRGHTSSVWNIAFSPDGSRLASGSSDRTIRLWDGITGDSIATLEGHTGWLQDIAFSPDGSRLASGSGDETIRLWDGITGDSIATLEGHTIAFSPDGSRLASGSSDKTIRLWDGITGDSIATLEGHTDSVWNIAFSPDGSRLASGSDDETIRLWDGITGDSIATLEGHTDSVWNIAFSPDGSRLASGSSDKIIRLWDGITGDSIATLEGHTDSVWNIAFSPDGSRLASGSDDETIRLWDGITGDSIATLEGHTDSVWNIAFSPDGSRLASGSDDETIRLWDGITGDSIATFEGHTGRLQDIAFSPDGSRLASGNDADKTIRLWGGITGAPIATLEGHTGSVRDIAFSPDGSRLASGSDDRTIRLWWLTSARGRVHFAPSNLVPPAVGVQMTVNIAIDGGESVAGYQASVAFDPTALRYVSSAAGDYLPANAFFAPVKVEADSVRIASTSGTEERDGNGILATLVFEVLNVKASTLSFPHVILSDNNGGFFYPDVEHARVLGVAGDINGDGAVNIADLVLVAGQFEERGENTADVNSDGVVNIADLVLVAGALGEAAAAPSVWSQDQVEILVKTNVQAWLREARRLNLTDAVSQRGILFLESLLTVLTPKETALLANYPNPFNPETWIPYQLVKSAEVTLHIYSINGMLIRTLALGHQASGLYYNKSRATYWDGRNEHGEHVASGIYFYTLTTGDFTSTRKMLIRK